MTRADFKKVPKVVKWSGLPALDNCVHLEVRRDNPRILHYRTEYDGSLQQVPFVSRKADLGKLLEQKGPTAPDEARSFRKAVLPFIPAEDRLFWGGALRTEEPNILTILLSDVSRQNQARWFKIIRHCRFLMKIDSEAGYFMIER